MDPDTRRQAYPADRGFTLVEVVISISLFAVALTLLTGGFRFTSKAWDAGDRGTAQNADIATVHRVFGNMIDRLFPVSLTPLGQEGYAFSGSSDSLRFTARLPPYPTAGGLYSVEFAITGSNGLERLLLSVAPFNGDDFPSDELKTEEKSLLLETTGRLSFSYAGGENDAEWQQQWPTTGPPPQLIRLQLKEVQKPWPEIVVPVSIDMDHACAFPDLGGECRLDLQ